MTAWDLFCVVVLIVLLLVPSKAAGRRTRHHDHTGSRWASLTMRIAPEGHPRPGEARDQLENNKRTKPRAPV